MGLNGIDGITALAILGQKSDEEIVGEFRRFIRIDKSDKKILDALKLINIDVKDITDGWSEDESSLFRSFMVVWALMIEDLGDAALFLLAVRHFLTSERRKNKALMQMVRTLSGEEKEKTENEDE